MEKLFIIILFSLVGVIAIPVVFSHVIVEILEYYEKTPFADSLMTTFYGIVFVAIVVALVFIGILGNASGRKRSRR